MSEGQERLILRLRALRFQIAIRSTSSSEISSCRQAVELSWRCAASSAPRSSVSPLRLDPDVMAMIPAGPGAK